MSDRYVEVHYPICSVNLGTALKTIKKKCRQSTMHEPWLYPVLKTNESYKEHLEATGEMWIYTVYYMYYLVNIKVFRYALMVW